VQSYGTRYTRPPIIHGAVARREPMTVSWTAYAQSLTDRPVKGMLTGPITMLLWSFPRDDQPLGETARQIALAIRDEVGDLDAAGVPIIQVDEPAIREGLPLRRARGESYLEWAVDAFRIATSVARPETQVHTHMCYSEFGDIVGALAALDADVASIEAARSQMDLLDAFAAHGYQHALGPGVWDIHSPRVPSVHEITALIERAITVLGRERVWVNPDCGLKTRAYTEVEPALRHLVAAARNLRQ
jgi:5-methyltetrahydropteroyltriglutamate--homocysteine methyltransferase